MKNSQKGLTKVVALFAILFVALCAVCPTNVMAKTNAPVAKEDPYVTASETLSITDNVSEADDTYTVDGSFEVVPSELSEESQKAIDVMFVIDSSGSMAWDLSGEQKTATDDKDSRSGVVKSNAIK